MYPFITSLLTLSNTSYSAVEIICVLDAQVCILDAQQVRNILIKHALWQKSSKYCGYDIVGKKPKNKYYTCDHFTQVTGSGMDINNHPSNSVAAYYIYIQVCLFLQLFGALASYVKPDGLVMAISTLELSKS